MPQKPTRLKITIWPCLPMPLHVFPVRPADHKAAAAAAADACLSTPWIVPSRPSGMVQRAAMGHIEATTCSSSSSQG